MLNCAWAYPTLDPIVKELILTKQGISFQIFINNGFSMLELPKKSFC